MPPRPVLRGACLRLGCLLYGLSSFWAWNACLLTSRPGSRLNTCRCRCSLQTGIQLMLVFRSKGSVRSSPWHSRCVCVCACACACACGGGYIVMSRVEHKESKCVTVRACSLRIPCVTVITVMADDVHPALHTTWGVRLPRRSSSESSRVVLLIIVCLKVSVLVFSQNQRTRACVLLYG